MPCGSGRWSTGLICLATTKAFAGRALCNSRLTLEPFRRRTAFSPGLNGSQCDLYVPPAPLVRVLHRVYPCTSMHLEQEERL